MSATGSIWDIAGELIVWGAASGDESDGKGQVSLCGDAAVGEDTRPDVEHLALPGFYSVISIADPLLTLRRDDGGISIGARTPRPTGATAGDRGILTDDIHLRMRGTKASILKLTGSGPKYVARDDDTTHANTTMAAWIAKVQAIAVVLDPTIIAPTDFGVIDATSTTAESD